MKQIIGFIVIVALIIGAVFLFRSRNSESVDANATSTASNSTTGDTTNVVGMKTTLGGIFDDPGSYECDYEQVSQQSRATNVVYIANGKLRGEFRTTTATSTTLSMVVYDGTYSYVWTEGKTTGKISQPKTLADLPGIIPQDITSGRILGGSATNVSWDCHAWIKDTAKLVKPAYVTFN